MTKKDLESIYELNKDLRMWQERLSFLQSDIALSPKILDGMPYSVTNKNGDPTQAKAIKLMETSKVIEGKIAEIQLIVMDAEQYILKIDDPLMRQILELRCVQFKTWREIGEQVNYDYSYCRRMYDDFFNEKKPQKPQSTIV